MIYLVVEALRRIISIWICFIMVFGSIVLVMEPDSGGEVVIDENPLYIVHAPIKIDSNADFTAANGVTNWATANGTIWNPWIIDGWDFQGPPGGNSIQVNDTTDHFIIQDCYFHGFRGFFGFNISNGRIRDNVFNDTSDAITFDVFNTSSNMIIENNTITNILGGGTTAIVAYKTTNVLVLNNTIMNVPAGNGIYFGDSTGVVKNNTLINVRDGIHGAGPLTTDLLIGDNYIENASQEAIYIWSGADDVVCVNNYVWK